MKAIFIFLTILLAACTNEGDANRALSAAGFKQIQYTGYSVFACAKDDFYHTGFTAVNANGLAVSGTVCSGLAFKGSTIRF